MQRSASYSPPLFAGLLIDEKCCGADDRPIAGLAYITPALFLFYVEARLLLGLCHGCRTHGVARRGRRKGYSGADHVDL